MVSSFDNGNIYILKLCKKHRKNKTRIYERFLLPGVIEDIYDKNSIEMLRKSKSKGAYGVIAIDSDKADFGGVF